MTTDGKDKGREIDPDKLVHRLLDMIQQQQDELMKVRQQMDYVLHAAQLPPSPSLTPPNPIRVDPLGDGSHVQHSLPAGSPAAAGTHTPLARVLRDNAVFIGVCVLLAIATLVIALRPPTTEVVRLGQQLDQTQLKLKAAAAEQDKVVKERDDQIILLQKDLKQTEAALSQNEKALADALGQTTESPEQAAAPAAPAPEAPKLSPEEELAKEGAFVMSLQASAEQVDGAIGRNRDEFLQDARALAAARLNLYSDQLAVRLMRGEISGPDVARLEKKLEDFLPPQALEMSKEAQAGTPAPKEEALTTTTLPASVEALRELAERLSHALSARQTRLRHLEADITQAQKDIVATQDELAKTRALEISLRNHPPK